MKQLLFLLGVLFSAQSFAQSVTPIQQIQRTDLRIRGIAGVGFSQVNVSKADSIRWSTPASAGVTSWSNITGKPSIFSGSYSDLSGKPTLFSGSYTDLVNKPTLFSGSYSDLTNRPALFSGAYSDLSGKPTFAAAAITGSYTDLLNKPTIPTATSNLVNDSGFQTATLVNNAIATALTSKEGVLGNPSVNGYILSSTTSGTRTWIVPPSGGGSATTDASALTTGQLSDARLSSNVVTLSGTQTITGKVISGGSNTITAVPQSAVTNLTTDLTAAQTAAAAAQTTANGALTTANSATATATTQAATIATHTGQLSSLSTTAGNALPTATYNTNRTADQAVVAGKAPLASPAFTGVPTVPTAATTATGTQAASVDFVKNVFATIPSGGSATVDTTVIATRAYSQGVATFAGSGLTVSTTGLPSGTSLYIWNQQRFLEPGKATFIQGQFPSNAVVNMALGNGIVYVRPLVLYQYANSATFIVPNQGVPFDQYRVWVSDGTTRSNSIWYNRAEPHFTTCTDTYTGATMRIIGQNLTVKNGKPTVRLVNVTNATSQTAVITSALGTNEQITYTAPTITTGQRYLTLVSNGLPNATEVQSPDTLTGIGYVNADVYAIGEAWATKVTSSTGSSVINVKTDVRLTNKATANGTANDYTAIVEANVLARSLTPKGTVYFPDGDYYAAGSGTMFDLKNGVVFAGQSKAGTRLLFNGTTGTTGGGANLFHVEYDVSTVGIANMTLVNLGTGSGTGFGTFQGKEMFFSNVSVQMGTLGSFGFFPANSSSPRIDRVAIVNSDFDQRIAGSTNGPLQFNRADNIKLNGNTFSFSNGPGILDGNNIVWENSQLIKDVSYGKNDGAILHVASTDHVKNMLWSKTSFLARNGEISRVSNDNESPIWEDSNESATAFAGSVTSAASLSLTDTGITFPSSLTSNTKTIVRITSGTGAGQTRFIVGQSANTLTIDKPWDVIPDNTSKYATGRMTAQNVTMANCTWVGMQRGPTVYFANTDNMLFRDGGMINSGAVDINPIQQIRSGGRVQVGMTWNISQRDFKIDSQTDPDNGHVVGVHGWTDAASLGTQALNCDFYRIYSIQSVIPKTFVVDDNYPKGGKIAYTFKPGGPTPTIPTLAGIIFQNITTVNAEYESTLNAGSFGTIFINSDNKTSGARDNNGRSVGNSLNTQDF